MFGGLGKFTGLSTSMDWGGDFGWTVPLQLYPFNSNISNRIIGLSHFWGKKKSRLSDSSFLVVNIFCFLSSVTDDWMSLCCGQNNETFQDVVNKHLMDSSPPTVIISCSSICHLHHVKDHKRLFKHLQTQSFPITNITLLLYRCKETGKIMIIMSFTCWQRVENSVCRWWRTLTGAVVVAVMAGVLLSVPAGSLCVCVGV